MKARSLFPLFGILCLALLPLAGPARDAKAQGPEPVTVSFQDGALPDSAYAGTLDTNINEATPLSNYHDQSTLRLDGDDPAEAGYARTESAALVRWDISAIPPGSRVLAVEVTFNIQWRTPLTWQVYTASAPWNETQANWLRPRAGEFWEFSGARDPLDRGEQVGAFSSAASGPAAFMLNEAGVTMAQQWVNDPESNMGVLIANPTNPTDPGGITSSEALTVSGRPKLTVVYDPPPALNTAPVANALAFTTPEDTLLAITPAGSDAEGDPLVGRIAVPPANGQVTRAGGKFYYRPNLHFSGFDFFSYTMSDGRAQSAAVFVEITVEPVNDPPVPTITADLVSGTAPLTVNLTAGAWDEESGPESLFAYTWDFADGSTAMGESVLHTFSEPGAYPVTLAAEDEEGASGQMTKVIMVWPASPPAARPNVILFVGDGMGMEQVRAAGLYKNGLAGTLLFEQFPYQATMETRSASNDQTDSAAAATAMATGVKVNNSVVSLAIPGDGRELYTVLEAARDRGQRTGLVTTNNITDATPAGFGAHEVTRANEAGIAADMLAQTRPNVLFGAGGYGMTATAAAAAGYQVITDRAGLDALDRESAAFVSGQFGQKPLQYEVDWVEDGRPHLHEMTRAALEILDNDPDGFFLMVEDENTDRGAHLYDLPKVVGDVLELERAVGVAVDWARTHPNTLIVVLADHETSGLTLLGERGRGSYPDSGWTVYNHTGLDVNVYALGVWASLVSGRIDNTQIGSILQGGTFNHPPAASAATEDPVIAHLSTLLTGAASDDTLPQPHALTYAWEVLSGPGAVEFEDASALSTQAVFRAPGRYTLRFTAFDGDLPGRALLVVDVRWGHFVPLVSRE